jgi:hypothetical protein
LKGIGIFNGLSIRQLVDLAQLMREETHAAEVPIVQEGECDVTDPAGRFSLA